MRIKIVFGLIFKYNLVSVNTNKSSTEEPFSSWYQLHKKEKNCILYMNQMVSIFYIQVHRYTHRHKNNSPKLALNNR